MKTDKEKQATGDARNERRREKATTEKGMADVATLSIGDTFIHDDHKYRVLSIDGQSGHIHTNLLEEEETPGTHGSVGFGTMVDVIAKVEEVVEVVEVVETPVPDNPAIYGGRWYK